MIQRRLRAAFIVVVFVPFTLMRTARASEGPPPILNPKSYTSASGDYVLEVDPSTMYGQGEGLYRLTRNGGEVWKATHPFTLWEAEVTDDGAVAGYAYTHGWRGFAEHGGFRAGMGDFHVVIFDPSGKLRLNEVTERTQSRFLHTPPNPLARGMFVDEDNDRFIVRLANEDVNVTGQHWRTYQLSTGTRLDDVKVDQAGPFIAAARPVRGTPLVLVNLWVNAYPRAPGARFVLLDAQGRSVWSIDLDEDYGQERRARVHYLQQGSILSSREPRRFEIAHVKDAKRVTYEVKIDDGAGGKWSVVEVARADFPPPGTQPETYAAIDLKHLGSIELGSAPVEHPVRKIWDFEIDGQGRIGFLRHDLSNRTFAFVTIDADGSHVREVKLDGFGGKERWKPALAWLGGERWVATDAGIARDSRSRGWFIDVGAGRATRISGFEPFDIEALAGTGDGGFVALIKHQSEHTIVEAVAWFDRDGQQRWMLGDGERGRRDLMGAHDVAVTTDGRVAVNCGGAVRLYSRAGEPLTSIELREVLDAGPQYPTDLAADGEGGLILHDFAGKPPIYRLGPDGKVTSSFQPRFPDGKTFRLRGGVKRAPDGALWTSDGEALLRIGADGVVEHVLGEKPTGDTLTQISAVTVDAKGLIYAVDRRTGAVHVFNQSGKLLRVCKPDPGDFSDDLFTGELAVAPSGEVYVGGAMRRDGDAVYVHFDPTGKRVGALERLIDPIKESWHFAPDGARWVAGYQAFHLLDQTGTGVLRTVKRRPDRNWLGTVHALAVAPSGELAVLCSSNTWNDPALPAVCVYDAAGEGLWTVTGVSGYHIAFNGTFVAVGGRAVHLVDPVKGQVRTFVPPRRAGEQEYAFPLFSPDGNELWQFIAGTRRIDRYELPAAP